MPKPKVFPESRALDRFLAGNGHRAYDLGACEEGRDRSWEETVRQGPARSYAVGHEYVLLPNPRNGYPLKKAAYESKGIGPSIRLPELDAHKGLKGRWPTVKGSEFVYFFNHLLFMSDGLCTAFERKSPELPCFTPLLLIPYERVMETFNSHFRIITPKELEGTKFAGATIDGLEEGGIRVVEDIPPQIATAYAAKALATLMASAAVVMEVEISHAGPNPLQGRRRSDPMKDKGAMN